MNIVANTPSEGAAPVAATQALRPRRGPLLGAAVAVVVVIGVVSWWLLAGQYRETTEDAYVDGNVVAVTAQVGGVVTAIGADDTDYVSAGSNVVKLDDTDARLALARAKAQLARSVRQVRAQYAKVGQSRANLQLREVQLARAKADLARRRELLDGGAISGEEVKHAGDAVRAATAALAVAPQQVGGSSALVDRAAISTKTEVVGAT
jgi:membrane fusion protein (multidrug efflux system)